MTYLSKAERRTIAEILESMGKSLYRGLQDSIASYACSRSERRSMAKEGELEINRWLFELSRILMVPIKQVGDEKNHIKQRTAAEAELKEG